MNIGGGELMTLSKIPGIVLHLPMNEKCGATAFDNSRYDNDGSLGGGTPANMPVWVEHGLRFDGTDDYININSVLATTRSDTTGTWSAWVKPVDATPPVFCSLVAFGDTNASENAMLYINTNGQLYEYFRVSGSTQWVLKTDSSVFSDGVWTHISVVQNGTEPTLYIDGISVPQTFEVGVDKTKWLSDASGLDNGRIGDRNFDSNGEERFFLGSMADVRVYNRALSAAEINDLYNERRHLYV